MNNKALKVSRLRELFRLDIESGKLFWLAKSSNQSRVVVGEQAGALRPDGYRTVRVDTAPCLEHRVVWTLVHGYWPEHELDHINGVRYDNRPSNLRAATRTENTRNCALSKANTSGVKGVYFEHASGKWKAQIGLNGVRTNLGRFSTVLEAGMAYIAAAKEHFKEFVR